MKNFIVTLVAMLVVFCANAQTISCISTRDPQACGEYLVKNPQDTIVNQFRVAENGKNGIVTRSVYMKHGMLYAKNDTTFIVKATEKIGSDKENLVSLLRKSEAKYGISAKCHHSHGLDYSFTKTDLNSQNEFNANEAVYAYLAEMYAYLLKKHEYQAKKQTEKEKTLFCSSFLLICAIGSLGGALVAKKAK